MHLSAKLLSAAYRHHLQPSAASNFFAESDSSASLRQLENMDSKDLHIECEKTDDVTGYAAEMTA